MQRSTSSGTSDSVSCCSDKVSPALPAAFWMAWTQPRKSSFLSPWMYSVLPTSPASVRGASCPPQNPLRGQDPWEGWPWGPGDGPNSLLGVPSHRGESEGTPG